MPDVTPPETAQQPARRVRPRGRLRWLGTWKGGVLLAVVCGALYLPGLFSLPPVDRDESRFAEASRRMAASSGWRGLIVPTIQDRPRLNKPPLIYWLQAASVKLFGARVEHRSSPEGEALGAASLSSSGGRRSGQKLPDGDIWAYRMPSILGAIVAALVTWRVGTSMYGRRCGWLAGLLLGSCVLVLVDARQARADQVLLATTTVAQGALWWVWRRRAETPAGGWGWPVVFWVSVGLGIMTKGPVTLVVAALTVLALCIVTRDWHWVRRLRPSLGGIVLAAMILPWLALVVHMVGWSTVRQVIFEEVFRRSITAREGHVGPPGYYLLLLPLLFWPGSLALVPALVQAVRRGLRGPVAGAAIGSSRGLLRWLHCLRGVRPGRSAELFCLAWLVPSWIIFELVATKLPHYILPLCPALAILCARSLREVKAAWVPLLRRRVVRFALWGWVVLGEVVAVVLPVALVWLCRPYAHPRILLAAAVAILVSQAVVVALVVQLRRTSFVRGQLLTVGAAWLTTLSVFQLALPSLEPIWISSRLAAEIREVDPGGRRALAAVGYQEDSLIFLTGGRAQRLSLRLLPDWLRRHPDGLVVITARAGSACAALRRLAVIEGFHYPKGRHETVWLAEADRGMPRNDSGATRRP